jgi:hypothetical protein
VPLPYRPEPLLDALSDSEIRVLRYLRQRVPCS